MAEQGDQPLPPSGDPAPAPGDSPPPSADDPPAPLAGAPGPDDYAGLLAMLGHYLDRHAPDEVVVLLRAELDRRETAAYASGWRDAAARYEPALAEARAANGRALRLVRRAPGQAVVIPLRQEGPETDGADPDGARANGDGTRANAEAGQARKRSGSGGPGGPGGAGAPASQANATGGRRSAAPPALVPKSPGSRAPTIPRLRTNRRRPDDDGRAGASDGGAL
ncbi:hypothetical protein D1J63_14965 [Streptomyces sp. KPB2]|uniref:hypothetical protein n=1 Tax=unclassified Streptomyces TaxID=2593676 RepID=UPI000F7184CA|nr:hypothetical protein [Streptomyces sp. KPB2]AZM76130.1 hypothetical protein D1J63_14965 [Streptomyces sp. KPB2]